MQPEPKSQPGTGYRGQQVGQGATSAGAGDDPTSDFVKTTEDLRRSEGKDTSIYELSLP